MSATQSRNAEIITVLDQQNAIWQRCAGPNGNGLDFVTLLGAMQAAYPSTGWTSSLLASVLASGTSQGRYKEYPLNTFYLNQDMVTACPCNQVYQQYSSQICGTQPLPGRAFIAL